jgi:hypothetical protein
VNSASTTLERPTRALLDLIEAERARQRGQILGSANAKATALRDQARADALARLRHAFAEQRQRRRERIAAAQAQLATQRRLHEQQHTTALLHLAWAQLRDELLALWRDPASRAAWVSHALAFARARLPCGAWRIAHAPDWPATEQRSMAEISGGALLFHADNAIRAGLKIEANGNIVDATLDGLLAERSEFEAQLLRELEDRETDRPE